MLGNGTNITGTDMWQKFLGQPNLKLWDNLGFLGPVEPIGISLDLFPIGYWLQKVVWDFYKQTPEMVSIPKIFTIPNLKKSQLVNVKNFHWQKKINPILSKFNSKKAWTVFICQLLNYCEVTNELNSRIFFRKIKMKGPIPIPASIKRNFQAV